jgi:hypothetical protein
LWVSFKHDEHSTVDTGMDAATLREDAKDIAMLDMDNPPQN